MNFLTWCGYSGNDLFIIFNFISSFFTIILSFLLPRIFIKKIDKHLYRIGLNIILFFVFFILLNLFRTIMIEIYDAIFGYSYTKDILWNYTSYLDSFNVHYIYLSLWMYILSIYLFIKKIFKKAKNKMLSIVIFIVFLILLGVGLFFLHNYIVSVAPNFDSWSC